MNQQAVHGESSRIHGGTDAQGTPKFDFSTNSNACGPCPIARLAVAEADASHYPDASYTVLRDKIAAFHAVESWRIIVAGSASEFIFRITALAKLQGVTRVHVPRHSFGDYAHAAKAWGLPLTMESDQSGQSALVWHCQPSSPLGQVDSAPTDGSRETMHVLDLAYAPLQLSKVNRWEAGRYDHLWQLYSPNKALGLTGVRAAYAIAPLDAQERVNQLTGLCVSWPLGAHGVVLLNSWVSANVQDWLKSSLQTLQIWKTRQIDLLESLGWICQPSVTNFFCATPRLSKKLTLDQALTALRPEGIKLRDTTSFGLPGQVRLSVQPPTAQDALCRAWLHITQENK
ncbi:MAG: aminotransferase class I/II-fold pyridoxal phosphate-dependent enzyme [Burkholderiaceae bacterium]|nr:aminotransferase class I/II-fold pyridoxal phosphate-dependent enzyme [Burkholderiaceae bacterium]